jgi:hypothetical protein
MLSAIVRFGLSPRVMREAGIALREAPTRQQALVEQQNSDRTSCCARVAWNIWERVGTQGNPRLNGTAAP